VSTPYTSVSKHCGYSRHSFRRTTLLCFAFLSLRCESRIRDSPRFINQSQMAISHGTLLTAMMLPLSRSEPRVVLKLHLSHQTPPNIHSIRCACHHALGQRNHSRRCLDCTSLHVGTLHKGIDDRMMTASRINSPSIFRWHGERAC
jgi:hypothetical protein